MTALAVAFYVGCSWLILLAIRDMRRDTRRRRHRRSFIARHEADRRRRQLDDLPRWRP